MARSRKHTGLPLPGLFDSLDDFSENPSSDFRIIPDKEMESIAQKFGAQAAEKPAAIDELPPMEAPDRVFFMSFGSGSSGNCSYIGDRSGGLLIDAGVELGKVTEGLRANGISMDRVGGILLTHDHGDHIRDVYQLLRRYRHLRVYCTPKALNGILRRHNVSRRIKDYHAPIYKEFTFTIGNFQITPFEVMHDGADNAGFFIEHGDCRFAIATDLGCISERVDHYMRRANHIVIEANYDLRMLREGRYPEYLKARIEAPNGHMDNAATGRFLAEIYTPELRSVFLCHLSHDNNTPETALAAVGGALRGRGVDRFSDGTKPAGESGAALTLCALPRFTPSPLFTLD